MTMTTFRRIALAAGLTTLAGAPLAAQQQGNEREFRWSKSVPAASWVRLHNITGNVTVTATDGERVELVATRRGSSTDPETRVAVHEYAGGVAICVLHSEDSYCDERGSHSERSRSRRWNDDDHASYDLEVRMPRRLHVSAASVSGDVRVSGTTGELRTTSVSGDIRLDRVRAVERFTATSVSGDVTALLDQVDERAELSIRSVSGDVAITMPRSAGVDLSMSTVSGELESDFELALRGRLSKRRINATIGRGGADMQISTVSGDVRLAARND